MIRSLGNCEQCWYKHFVLANTLFPHKLSRRTTWHSPGDRIHNQIDYILVPQRFRSSINRAQTRTFPGADVGSDHDLVFMNFKLKLSQIPQQKFIRLKFDADKLKDPTVHEAFKAKLGEWLACLNLLVEDVDSLTEDMNSAITETAEEVLGRSRKKKEPWVTEEVFQLCDERRELRVNKHQSEEAFKQHRDANTKVRKAMRKAKNDWLAEQCLQNRTWLQIAASQPTQKQLTRSINP